MNNINTREIAKMIVVPGTRGTSNKQVLEGMRGIFEGKFPEIDQTEALTALYVEYKSIFESSCKYVPDGQKVLLERFLKTMPGNEEIELNIGKRTRHMMEMGIDPLADDARDQLNRLEANEEIMFKLTDIVNGSDKWKSTLTEDEITMVIDAVEADSVQNHPEELETILAKIA